MLRVLHARWHLDLPVVTNIGESWHAAVVLKVLADHCCCWAFNAQIAGYRQKLQHPLQQEPQQFQKLLLKGGPVMTFCCDAQLLTVMTRMMNTLAMNCVVKIVTHYLRTLKI
eukprot:2220750-Amphidinium_carterae.2